MGASVRVDRQGWWARSVGRAGTGGRVREAVPGLWEGSVGGVVGQILGRWAGLGLVGRAVPRAGVMGRGRGRHLGLGSVGGAR